jgi:hypothetical protein
MPGTAVCGWRSHSAVRPFPQLCGLPPTFARGRRNESAVPQHPRRVSPSSRVLPSTGPAEPKPGTTPVSFGAPSAHLRLRGPVVASCHADRIRLQGLGPSCRFYPSQPWRVPGINGAHSAHGILPLQSVTDPRRMDVPVQPDPPAVSLNSEQPKLRRN